ncbi:MAG: OmpA family protein, partial [Pseudomonadales bacterium]|nr:OmpA family protein [Pseudomonadales bacterium]
MATFIQAGTSIKRILFITAVAAILSACASKQTQPEAPEEPTVVQEPEVVATPIDRAPTRVVEEPAPSLETVFYFDYDSSQLRSGARAALDAQAAYLRNTSTAIRLEGHADERGTREYN